MRLLDGLINGGNVKSLELEDAKVKRLDKQ